MKTNPSKIKRSRENLIFDIVTTVILCIIFVIVAYPLYFVIIASISDPYAVLNGEVLLFPKKLTFDSYKRIFEDSQIWRGYANSIAYTAAGTFLNVCLTMSIAFPLSRKYFSGRKVITTILLITMYFSGGMIPTYLLVQNLGLRDTFWVMILLGAVSVYNVIIARTFLESNIPGELEEAASIDGCSKLKFFFTMVLPLSKAIVAVLVLYYAVAHWNDYMRGLIYLDSANRYPLQLVIRSMLVQTQMAVNDSVDIADIDARMKLAEAMKYGVIIVSTLPTLVMYPFVQKHFVKGVMIGSVKG